MKLWLTLLVICGFGAAVGCGSDDDTDDTDDTAAIDCDKDTTGYNDISAFDQCVKCHSSELSTGERMSAPLDINFDTFEGATTKKALAAPEVVEAGAMPPKNSGIKITQEQSKKLITWYECGAKK